MIKKKNCYVFIFIVIEKVYVKLDFLLMCFLEIIIY